MSALETAAPGASRFVGGCVRDSLLGIQPHDVDIATQLRPEETTAALHAAGLGAAPTGLDHGTVTGIADHVGVEITTLRADVSTDGRRASVAFSQDWRVDAERRDFTMNALYLTPDRLLFDPVGGLADLEAGRVRFIGDAHTRIREDYLRILRFFRFSARFAARFDAQGLRACARLSDGVGGLSAERVGDEFCKILTLSNAAAACEKMAETSVMAAVWPGRADVGRLARLKALDPDAPAPLGLAALFGDRDRDGDGDGDGAERTIDAALRLSNADAARRKAAVRSAAGIDHSMDARSARALLYRLGAEAWRDAVLLAAAQMETPPPGWRDLRELPSRWTPPPFPLGGRDVLAAGVEKGPRVAAVLKAVEDRWIAEDFPHADRAREILFQEVRNRT